MTPPCSGSAEDFYPPGMIRSSFSAPSRQSLHHWRKPRSDNQLSEAALQLTDCGSLWIAKTRSSVRRRRLLVYAAKRVTSPEACALNFFRKALGVSILIARNWRLKFARLV